jgi:uncharacterized membrane protein YgcG
MMNRSTSSVAFVLVVAGWLWCILGHGAVQAQNTTHTDCDNLGAACGAFVITCQSQCNTDSACYGTCGEAANPCAQALQGNCMDGVTNPCDPNGSLAFSCATAWYDCQTTCDGVDADDLDCSSACAEDLQKCINEISNNCSGGSDTGETSGGDGEEGAGTGGSQGGDGENDTPDDNGEEGSGGGGTPQGGGVVDSPTSTSSQESGNGASDAMIMNTGKAGLLLVPVLTLLW